MKALIVFSRDNAHPLAWLLHAEIRHVFCAVLDPDRGWVSYDWDQGVPKLRLAAAPDFDLASFYRGHGYRVVERDVADPQPTWVPWTLNNCVSQTKLICALQTWALTPYQLHKFLRRQAERRQVSAPARAARWMSRLRLSLPGFGGGGDSTPVQALPPTPAPAPEFKPPPKDKAESKAEYEAKVKKLRQEHDAKFKPGSAQGALRPSGAAGNSGPSPSSGASPSSSGGGMGNSGSGGTV